MYAELKTKDGKAGVIVLAESIDEIVEECFRWMKDEGYTNEALQEGFVQSLPDEQKIGTLTATEDAVICTPFIG